MRNRIIIISIIALILILLTSTSFAATGIADLKTNTKQVKKGDTFTIILYAESEDGINGIETKYMYNTEILEKVSEKVVDTTTWVSLGTSPEITIICNSENTIKKADIYALEFKVKDEAEVGSTFTIETTDILLDTDAQIESEVKINAKKIEFEVINSETNSHKEEEGTKEQGQGTKEEEKGTKEQEQSTKEDEKGTKEQESSTKEDGQDTSENKQNVKEQTQEKSNIQENDTKTIIKSNATNTKSNIVTLPKTGKNAVFTLVFIVIGIIISIILYKKYNTYIDI